MRLVPPVQFFACDRGQRLQNGARVAADGTADAGVELQGNGKPLLRIILYFGEIAWEEAAVTVGDAERRFTHHHTEAVADAGAESGLNTLHCLLQQVFTESAAAERDRCPASEVFSRRCKAAARPFELWVHRELAIRNHRVMTAEPVVGASVPL